jgi:hypothetical protein
MLWIHNTEFKIYQREEYVPAACVPHPNPDLDPPDPRFFGLLDLDPSIIMQK